MQECHVESIRKTLADWFKSHIQPVPLLPDNIVRRDPFADEMLKVLTNRLGPGIAVDSERFITITSIAPADGSSTASSESARVPFTPSTNTSSSPLRLPEPDSANEPTNSLDLDDVPGNTPQSEFHRQRSDWL